MKQIIFQGDCLDILKKIPDESIDLIITSPPYADARKNTYGGSKPEDYIEWFIPRSNELKRVLKSTGSFFLNIKEKCVNGERHTYVIELILEMKKTGWRWVEEYIWHKKKCMPMNPNRRLKDAWERILHFSKTKNYNFYPDKVKVPAAESYKSSIKRKQKKYGNNKFISKTKSGSSVMYNNFDSEPDLVYPSNVIHKSSITYNAGHPAAYPIWLPEFFINLCAKKGDIVLDPFLGSGTTAVASKNMGISCIGIEQFQEYVEVAHQRLENPNKKFS